MSDSEMSREKLIDDFSAVLAEAEEMLKRASAETGDKARDRRWQVETKLLRAKPRLQEPEGEAGDRYYVLESGRLRVTIDGREVRVVDQAGTGMGEIALLHNVRRTATLTAVTPCVLLALERSDFLEAVTGHEATHAVVRETAAGHTMGPPG